MKWNGKNTLLACSDDIIILEDTNNEIISSTQSLINSSEIIGISISDNKTKYIVRFRRVTNKSNLKLYYIILSKWINFETLEFISTIKII